MAEPLRPTPAKTYGRKNWIFVPTIASAAAPTAAELTAASALDITNIAFADGEPTPTQSTNLVAQQRRVGDTTENQFVGTTTYAGGDMTYALDPQAAALSSGVKAWETLGAGTTGYLVRRLGVSKATAVTAGQFVDVFPVEFGPSMPTESGDGESREAAAVCTFAIVGQPQFRKAVA